MQPNVATSWLVGSNQSTNISGDWKAWWPDDGLQEWLDESGEPIAGVLPRSTWPLRIRGQEVGVCSNLVDLTVDSGNMIARLMRSEY